jgi:hypothetical protein
MHQLALLMRVRTLVRRSASPTARTWACLFPDRTTDSFRLAFFQLTSGFVELHSIFAQIWSVIMPSKPTAVLSAHINPVIKLVVCAGARLASLSSDKFIIVRASISFIIQLKTQVASRYGICVIKYQWRQSLLSCTRSLEISKVSHRIVSSEFQDSDLFCVAMVFNSTGNCIVLASPTLHVITFNTAYSLAFFDDM